MIAHVLSPAICMLVLLSLSACSLNLPGFQPVTNPPVEADPTAGECANSYFPVVQGATWTYTASGHLSGGIARTITAIRDDGFTEQHTAPGGDRSMEWDCSDGLIARQPETTPSGLVRARDLTTDLHTTDTSGVTIPDIFQPGTKWNQESTMDGTATLNGQKAPAHSEIMTECMASSHDSVPVPAGTFEALRGDCKMTETITVTLNGAPITTEIVTVAAIWYAPGVGMVKLEQAAANGAKTTLELVSYHIP
jgi:hypothetical protein